MVYKVIPIFLGKLSIFGMFLTSENSKYQKVINIFLKLLVSKNDHSTMQKT